MAVRVPPLAGESAEEYEVSRWLVVLALLFVLAACAQPNQETIHLQARTIRLTEGVGPDLVAQLERSEKPRVHALVQLRTKPDADSRDRLQELGVDLLFHVQPRVWVASLDTRLDPNAPVLLAEIRWMGAFQARDKIGPGLRSGRYADWAVEEDGRIRVSIEFFADVPLQEAEALVAAYSDRVERWAVPYGWYAIVPRSAIEPLAGRDEVKRIEQGPVPFQPFIDYTRPAIQADAAHNLDLSSGSPVYRGASGVGVQVGIWDTGIDGTHEDFLNHDAGGAITGSRIVVARAPFADHGTWVAGVLGASGFRSGPCGLGDYSRRGVAPEIELLAYTPFRDFGPATPLVADAIRTHGMDVSNHSYLQGYNGLYTGVVRSMDRMVRGAMDWDGAPIPPRPAVWAAGNNGRFAAYSTVEGYFSVEAPAKNTIAVGATFAGITLYPDHLVGLSSLGPTWDGRIKPDLVAPGDSVKSTRPSTNCYTLGHSGTSISAPAVAGTIALVLQDYARTYDVDLDVAPPLPSTVKAALIQSAKDLVHDTADIHDWLNPDTGAEVLYYAGPDYATGYGLIDALAATGLVRQRNLVEGTLTAPAEIVTYSRLVPPGLDRLQFTLAWDDEVDEDSFGVETDPRLVNDLELRLVEPGTGILHRPWVLPPLTPAATPGDVDPIAPAEILPAAPGDDHLNNVEQVTVNSPSAGLWTVQVSVAPTSPGLLAEPQPFSIAGDFHQRFHFTDWGEDPGAIYRVEGGAPVELFRATSGHIYHIAFADDGTLYISNSNADDIVSLAPGGTTVEPVFTHTTFSRDIALDEDNRLHFSEATGATADGTIYRLDGGSAVPVYTVRLADVGGYWAGDFTFDPSGALYISTGNRIGGKVYRIDDPAASSPPVEVYSLSGEAITGIAFDRDGGLFFTNWDEDQGYIWRLDLADSSRGRVHSFNGRRIWDVAFR